MPTDNGYDTSSAKGADIVKTVKQAVREVLSEQSRQILVFNQDDEDCSDFDFQCANRAKGFLEVLSHLLDGIRNSIKYDDRLGRRDRQVLEKVRDDVWAAADDAGVSDLMEEWSCGGGGAGTHFEAPPLIEGWEFDHIKLDPGVRLTPDGKVMLPRPDGHVEPELEGPRRWEDTWLGSPRTDPIWIEVGHVEWLEGRKAWHGRCKAAGVWLPIRNVDALDDGLGDLVREIVDLHKAATDG